MAGTQAQVEDSPVLVAQTVLTASSNLKNSLQGINVNAVVDGAICFVRENQSVYRYYQSSALAESLPSIVTPAVPTGAPGRWLLISTDDANALAFGPPHATLGFEDLTGATTQALGDSSTFVSLTSPPFTLVTGAVLFTEPSNGVLRYGGTAPRWFNVRGRVSISFATAISVSGGIGIVGTPVSEDPAPQVVVTEADAAVPVQLNFERQVFLSPTSTDVVIRLRSNTGGSEALIVRAAELVASPM